MTVWGGQQTVKLQLVGGRTRVANSMASRSLLTTPCEAETREAEAEQGQRAGFGDLGGDLGDVGTLLKMENITS